MQSFSKVYVTWWHSYWSAFTSGWKILFLLFIVSTLDDSRWPFMLLQLAVNILCIGLIVPGNRMEYKHKKVVFSLKSTFGMPSNLKLIAYLLPKLDSWFFISPWETAEDGFLIYCLIIYEYGKNLVMLHIWMYF